jgi:DNA-binding NtrC family response regulator
LEGVLAERRLFLQQAQASRLELASRLSDLGWTIRISHDSTATIRAEEIAGCDVGVIVLDPIEAFDPAKLERLTATNALAWIAVLKPDTLDESEFARVILKSCYDFHTLPLDIERLNVVLGRAYGMAQLGRRVSDAVQACPAKHPMIGDSPIMLDLYRSLDKIARADAPVLISGESGTGKELAASAIHRNSVRHRGPFVAVNCGALPPNLIQSELFGHEKGSFTGAHQRKIGSIEAAAGGVVFLDEIGDLGLDLQANLLRFLQERTIVRVGSTQAIPIDVRVIAATHIDLARAVAEGRFREDLFYRLNVLHLDVPPLRARMGDITLLANAMFSKFHNEKSPQVKGFSIDALSAMEAYAWPGNVRELINRVQHAMIMCDGRLIMPDDLGLGANGAMIELPNLRSARQSTEKDVVLQILQHSQYNISAAARQLGVSRVTLYRMIEKHKIDLRVGAGTGLMGSAPSTES